MSLVVTLLYRIFVFLFIIKNYEVVGAAPEDVCRTSQCHKIAKSIKTTLNDTLNACDDFYDYACGGLKYDVLPVYTDSWSTAQERETLIRDYIRRILTVISKKRNSNAISLARRAYRACMRKDMVEKESLKTALRFLELGRTWPIVAGDHVAISWRNMEMKYQYYGIMSIFGIKLEKITPRSTQYEIKLFHKVQPSLSETFVESSNDETERGLQYAKLLEIAVDDILNELNIKVDEDRLKQDLINLVTFAAELYSISLIPDDETNELWTVDQFQRFYDHKTEYNSLSYVNWLEMINNLFKNIIILLPDVKIRISSLKAFVQIGKLLSQSSERDIVNYIQWNAIGRLLPHTNQRMRETFLTYLFDTDIEHIRKVPRWQFCVANMIMKEAVAYHFSQDFLNADTLVLAESIVHSVRSAALDVINQADWMSDEMKLKVTKKIKNLKIILGYPNWYRNDTSIDEYYEELNIGSNYMDNYINYLRFQTFKHFQKYLEINVFRWPEGKYAFTHNTFSMPEHNAIVIPAAMFFDITPETPLAVVYGKLGMAIAHELGHTFDPSGIKLDERGNALKWKANELLGQYNRHIQCFNDQYSIDGVRNDHILRENIADNVGVRLAEIAFAESSKPSTISYPEINSKLPGLEYLTREQLFFLTYANSLCESENSSQSHTHSDARLRVALPVVNSIHFSTAFKCTKKFQSMNIITCTL